MKDNIRKLIDKLNYYTVKYDEGKPEISDQEWDDMYFELQNLENESGLYYPDSPTQNIIYQTVNKLEKVEHNHPMLSLDKTKDIEVIKAFLGNKRWIAMAKLDGLTCSLKYLNGELVSAETRGNGIIGEDILHNALHVKSIPHKISYKDELVIDGEIICTDEDFEKFSNEYKNSRNFASGSIRLLDSEECAARHLTFIAWDCISNLENTTTLTEKLNIISDLGFTIVDSCVLSEEVFDRDAVSTAIDIIQTVEKLKGYPIDGIVFKYNNIDEYVAAGRTDHHFKGGMAYKFYDEEYETTLQNIEWSMGRTGILTPVAIFEPIEIDGTEVSRASLSNVSVMRDTLGTPFVGEKLWVTKRNMIIPKVERAEKLEYNKSVNTIEEIQICPVCGGDLELKDSDGVLTLYCTNSQCSGKLINKLDYFCGKNGLDIKGLSTATLEKLIEWGWVSSYIDLYKLENKSNIWKNKAGFGEKSVERILNALEQSRNTTLDAVIAAAGIPLIGRAVAKELCKYITSYEDFRYKVETGFDFSQYEGFGEEKTKAILDFNYKDIDDVVDYALHIDKKEETKCNNKLQDLVFCVTGKVHIYKNRDELKADIESKGGKVVSSMSSKVNYLVNNDITSGSAKNVAAKKAGIPIITEEELRAMF